MSRRPRGPKRTLRLELRALAFLRVHVIGIRLGAGGKETYAVGKKRRRLERRVERRSAGEESPRDKRRAKPSDWVESLADGFVTSLVSSLLRAIGL